MNGKIKIRVHYLFYIVAFVYLSMGKLYSFVIYTLSDILHEIGHSLAAGKYGVRLGEIMLMPYGAVATEKTDGLKLKDDIEIALGGPLINLAVAVFFTAVWWIYPELYAFTDEIASANYSLFFINLLPAYSLDGGRILGALLSLKFSEKKSLMILRIIGATIGSVLSALFVVTCFTEQPNFTLAFFGVYLIISSFVRGEKYKYVRISEFLDKNISCGVKINLFAIDENATLKCLLTNLDTRRLNRAAIYRDGNKITELEQEEIADLCKRVGLYDSLKTGLK